MPTEVIMPKVDMDMATGQITQWFAGEGDQVEKGSCLFEIETDKAAMEVEAPAAGILRDITGKNGEDIPVGQVIGWIFSIDEDYVPQATAQPAAPAERPAEPIVPTQPTLLPQSNDAAIRATPLARRMAKSANLDLAQVTGSGPRGRIQRADIEHHLAAAPLASRQPADADAVLSLFQADSYELVPHDNMRKTIARRLVESKSTVPHFYLSADCNIDRLLTLRREINASAPTDSRPHKVSINDIVIKAMAKALAEVPDANVSWTESDMVRHSHVDVGVAVAIPGGLITPIVRKAEQKTLGAIALETIDLAARARTRKLDPTEYRGGTTAVSNLGMYGTREFSAIINPPHATILAVGSGERRPIILADGDTVAAATMMTITLSTDHRAVDGALAAELLAVVKRFLEDPIHLLI